MSFFTPGPGTPPPPPPPPPAAPMLAGPSLASQGASNRASLASGAGMGFSGTDVTGGQGVKPPDTTGAVGQKKSLLGG